MDVMQARRNLLIGGATPMGNILALITHGTEWIDTEYYPNSTQLMTFDLKLTGRVQYAHIFGATSGNTRFGIQESNNENPYYRPWLTTNSAVNINGANLYSSRCFGVIGTSLENTFDGSTLMPFKTATKSLLLFSGYYNGNPETNYVKCEFYGMKVIDSISFRTIQNFVPWLDGSTPCVKELKTGKLLYNSGIGNFGYIDLEGTVHDT